MLGLIGGTGLSQLENFDISDRKWFETPYGEPSAAVCIGELNGYKVAFMARHGTPHRVAPHLINYRANLSALKQAGVTQIIAINAVGGIHSSLGPAQVAIPDQIIDYTYGRAHTCYDGVVDESLEHIDFTFPYTASIREALILAAKSASICVLEAGTYGATQGPRLESAAEIQRFKRDGCDMVGMTGMPEAAIARELMLDYGCLALSVNWAAGLSEALITMDDIHKAIELGMGQVLLILKAYLKHSD
jgi:5'-deoxy-5'-methylthioadenosine phosphorylase